MAIFLLLGGMTIFVSVVLYSVITRVFHVPEPSSRRRRLSRRHQSRWYEVWFNAAVARIAELFLPVLETIRASFAAIHLFFTRFFRPSDDLQENRPSRANCNRCERCEAQPLVTPRTPTRSLRSTRASQRAKGPRAPPPTPVSSSESRERTPTRSPRSTIVHPRQEHPLEPLPSPAPSSGSTTVVGSPSRAPSIAAEDTTTQATPRRGRPTRLCEIKAFIASSLEPSFEGDVRELYNVPQTKQQHQLTASFQPAVTDAFSRLRTYMETNLNIAPGTCRLAALLSLIYELHFAISPERSLPVSNPEQSRYISARELACVFLNRYGPIVWPAEPEPAPHLTNLTLQFPRDATIHEERHQQWHELLVKPPIRGSAGDLAMSVLGQRMTAFVRLVYQLPVVMKAEPDWDAVALVLDDTRPGQEGMPIDEAEWSEALVRSAPYRN